MRTLLPLLALGLAFAPSALAQDANESAERPDDAAWVDDCPPDMMCAMGAGEGDETPRDGPSYDGDCGGEVCAYDAEPGQALGPEGCIDCMQPPAQDAQGDAPAKKDSVPFASVAAVLGIVAVAALGGVALLGRRR